MSTYIDGYGVERKSVTPLEKASNVVKSYFNNAKKNYKDLTETSGLGLLFPASKTEAALIVAGGPLLKAVGKGASVVVKGAKKISPSVTTFIEELVRKPQKVGDWHHDLQVNKWRNRAIENSQRYLDEGFDIQTAVRFGEQEAGNVPVFKPKKVKSPTPAPKPASPTPPVEPGLFDDVFKQGGILKRVQTANSGIKIKPENKGKFTKSAKAAGESVQEHAHKVMNDPDATTLQKRRANFAIQAKRWNKK